MSRFKLFAFIALITLAFSVGLVADAVAGEKVMGRSIYYGVKWEKIDVGDEEGHLIALVESKGITSNKEGKAFAEGWVTRSVGLLDINVKTGRGSGRWYEEITDRDGDKYYISTEGTRLKGKEWASYWKGEFTIVKGTGKYQGIQGKGTFSFHNPAPMQTLSDWEMEMELPKR